MCVKFGGIWCHPHLAVPEARVCLRGCKMKRRKENCSGQRRT
jgi:hypothetical protein